MTLQEIRDKFLSAEYPSFDAQLRLEERGLSTTTAEELLDLWQFETPDQPAAPAPEPPEPDTDRRTPVKLKEIREMYLGLKMTTNEARVSLRHAGLKPEAADELMSLWVGDEWERSERAKATRLCPVPDLDQITAPEAVMVYRVLCKMSQNQLKVTVLLAQALVEGGG